MDLAQFESRAESVATLMRLAGNQRRLMVLCRLLERGTATVTDLATDVGLSQSALSQHLALLREAGLVTFDRDGQTLHYRLADLRVTRLLELLYDLYCNTSPET